MKSPAILETFLALLDLERIEANLFRGGYLDIGIPHVFGGHVLAQALMAAQRTVVEERHAHSLHAYFLRPGDPKAPIVYDVDRIRDGRSFTTRRVVAIQHGRAIFNMSASFQVEESGPEHRIDPPEGVPAPHELPNEDELRRRLLDALPAGDRERLLAPRPIEIRPVDPENPFSPKARPPLKYTWFRAAGTLPADATLHKATLAYASDFGLLGASLLPHALSFLQPNLQGASLDHAMWFHRPCRADEWLLYRMTSPSMSNARGFNRGEIFTHDGVLVASVAQEGLVRLHPPSPHDTSDSGRGTARSPIPE
ncbi:MAG: acyl-CoA thioesterase II [Deltaproteobacteria bacterium]|nr:MAG: acyl-CoA thioesterase II [Deltaproteobacteria bacterium]